MFNNVALDVVIGLIFVYLLYSLLLTIIQEIIANWFSYRAKFLEKAIMRMLEDEIPDSKKARFGLRINPMTKEEKAQTTFTNLFYQHPLIKYLGEKCTKSKPAYLLSSSFSKTMIDLLRGDKVKPDDDIRIKIGEALETGVPNWETNAAAGSIKIGPKTLQYLNSLWVDARSDIESFRELLEKWFDETMDRATGWYKKYIQLISLLIGFCIALCFNVNTIAIAHKLEKDPELREQLVQQAGNYIAAYPGLADTKTGHASDPSQKNASPATEKNTNDSLDRQYDSIHMAGKKPMYKADSMIQCDIKKTNEILGLGLGAFQLKKCKDSGSWKNFMVQTKYIFVNVLGWLITALALSLGAPFWFDLLNKLMTLRTSLTASQTEGKFRKKLKSQP